jgi:NADH:ubiquinone oxidoreductase 27 kD subunit
MALEIKEIQNRLEEKFGDSVSNFRMEYDVFTLDVSPATAHDIIRFMHEDILLKFNFLTDLCAVHYPDNEKDSQFAVVYLLHNWIDNMRVRIKTYLNGDQPQIKTITDVFEAANWMERETYDFFGVQFTDHPNLKRILNVKSMVSFPLRKEYPLEDAGRSDKDDRYFGRIPANEQLHPIKYDSNKNNNL